MKRFRFFLIIVALLPLFGVYALLPKQVRHAEAELVLASPKIPAEFIGRKVSLHRASTLKEPKKVLYTEYTFSGSSGPSGTNDTFVYAGTYGGAPYWSGSSYFVWSDGFFWVLGTALGGDLSTIYALVTFDATTVPASGWSDSGISVANNGIVIGSGNASMIAWAYKRRK